MLIRTSLLRCCALGLIASGVFACEDEPARGALVVRVESDLALPKDLDLVRVDVTRGKKSLLAKERDLYDPQSRLLEFTIPFDGDSTPVEAIAVGYKSGEPQVERRAITPLPRSRKLLLAMSLRYLCTGKVGECEDGATCEQGRCTSAVVRSESLPEWRESGELESSRPDANAGDCMNVVQCFANASAPELDRESCSFPLTDDVDAKSLNVGLRFARGGSGTCGSDGCFIPLDADREGFRVVEGSVQLPPEVCGEGAPFSVVYSTDCPAKTGTTSICWEPPSATSAVTGTGPAPETSASVPPALGTSCEPPAIMDCGMCGVRTRTCRGGQWSEWGECEGRGACEPNAQEECGNRGTRVCGASCQWGECEGQHCDGPDTQSCGNCGARHRTCVNGSWTAWSECQGEGACKPNAVQLCTPEGSQVCGGNCQWDPCVVLACPGVPSRACDRCGTERRSCDAATGAWSEWGECTMQGECTPDEMKPCGENGRNTCLGNCRWDPVCRDQICAGPSSMPCDRCGTRTRTCDTLTGVWSEWGECQNQGACAPTETRVCGMRGSESCTASCEWSGTCSGQVCPGERTRACGRCGTQTRECDANTGDWGAWSACTNQGECAAGATGTCGADGMHTCGSDCRWGPCTGQSCREPLEQSCERCGKQQRTCDPSTGRVSAWSACIDQGACEGGDVGTCGKGGTHECTRDCEWPAECHNQRCDEPATRTCERCGTQRSTCNGDTGTATWGTCMNQGECAANQSQACGKTGKRSCSTACAWSACDCGADSKLCGDTCTNVQTDANNCGDCGQPCRVGQKCDAGKCVEDCAPPRGRCGSNLECVDLTTSDVHCGQCDNPCDTRSGLSCSAGKCGCKPPTSLCTAVCLDLENDPNHCGSCTNSCPRPNPEIGAPTCTKGVCGVTCFDLSPQEGPKYTACKVLVPGAAAPIMACVDLEFDAQNCGTCGNACPAGAECDDGECTGGTGGTGGGGAGGAGGAGGRLSVGPGANDLPINRGPIMITAGSSAPVIN